MNRYNDNEGPCDCCGHLVDHCICPECSMCGEAGNLKCYIADPAFGRACSPPKQDAGFPAPYTEAMTYSIPQLVGQVRVKVGLKRQALDDDAQYLDYVLEGHYDDTDNEVRTCLKNMSSLLS